jgi:hypothetical protein
MKPVSKKAVEITADQALSLYGAAFVHPKKTIHQYPFQPTASALTVSNPACQRGLPAELAVSGKNPARFPAILQDREGCTGVQEIGSWPQAKAARKRY